MNTPHFKKMNTYHFKFSIEIPDILTEQEQSYISKNLHYRLIEHLSDKGYHIPSIRVINKWYQEEN